MDSGPSRQGQLVDWVGPQKKAQIMQDSWSTPRDLRPGPESHGTADRTCGHSDPGPRRPGQLVNHPVPRTQARVAQKSWSSPRAIGAGPEWSGTAGRLRGPLGTSPSRPGDLVDTVGTRTLAQFNRHRINLAGTRTLARVTRDCWSTPRAFGPKRESPGTAGRPRRSLDPSASVPGQLVDPEGVQTKA